MPYIREIIQEGHPTLRKVAKKVNLEELKDPLMQQLFDDMFETMYDAPGIGLAAPQIGVSKRIFTIDLQDDKDEHGPFVVVNPKFELTEGAEWRKDGCLSYEGYVGETERYTRVIVTGFDRDGEKIRLEGTCSRIACSTRSTISTACSISTRRATCTSRPTTKKTRATRAARPSNLPTP